MASTSKSGSPNASASGPKPLWAHVDDWPQVPGHLRETLDAELISTHAVASLRRALDFQRVVGFIGSGVSMSYGRLGWGELVKWIDKSLKRDGFEGGLEQLVPEATSSGTQSRADHSSTYKKMEKLLAQLDLQGSGERSLDLQSGRFPAAFQFLEQMSRDPGFSPPEKPPSDSWVRSLLRAMLRDDAGHAYVLLRGLIDDTPTRQHPNSKSPGSADRMSQEAALDKLMAPIGDIIAQLKLSTDESSSLDTGVRQRSDRSSISARWQSLFVLKSDRLRRFRDRLPSDSAAYGLCDRVAEALNSSGAPLPPLLRFIVPALIRLDPQLACTDLLGPKTNDVQQGKMRRADRIPEGRDPLVMLMRDFGIRRFATTNYDLDIEQAFLDLGYDTASAGQHPSSPSPH